MTESAANADVTALPPSVFPHLPPSPGAVATTTDPSLSHAPAAPPPEVAIIIVAIFTASACSSPTHRAAALLCSVSAATSPSSLSSVLPLVSPCPSSASSFPLFIVVVAVGSAIIVSSPAMPPVVPCPKLSPLFPCTTIV
ncbi:hypothetical protein E2562_009604 [Oryza meyeriana var. granulata]|uniref:Uncharacterized protein n=1 Tax=Oryza meyeriana var. granulata TaxID=110450 RepID=A0A6G1BJQ5_9ORYZ|nr:hypothetical protein E2562_009604 [Oryza meyeriana var. granulata]